MYVDDKPKATIRQINEGYKVSVRWWGYYDIEGFDRIFPTRARAWDFARTWDDTPTTIK